MPSANVVWNRGLQFVGTSESGHAVVADSNKEEGGFESGPSPVELTLIGLGSCTGGDVVSTGAAGTTSSGPPWLSAHP